MSSDMKNLIKSILYYSYLVFCLFFSYGMTGYILEEIFRTDNGLIAIIVGIVLLVLLLSPIVLYRRKYNQQSPIGNNSLGAGKDVILKQESTKLAGDLGNAAYFLGALLIAVFASAFLSGPLSPGDAKQTYVFWGVIALFLVPVLLGKYMKKKNGDE